MGLTVEWYVPQRICIIHAEGDLTVEDLETGSNRVIELIQSGIAPVHCIADARKVTSPPKNLREIIKAARLFREPNLGWMMGLIDNSFIKFAASVVSQMSGVNYRVFSNPHDLITILKRIDPTLPELPPFPMKQVDAEVPPGELPVAVQIPATDEHQS